MQPTIYDLSKSSDVFWDGFGKQLNQQRKIATTNNGIVGGGLNGRFKGTGRTGLAQSPSNQVSIYTTFEMGSGTIYLCRFFKNGFSPAAGWDYATPNNTFCEFAISPNIAANVVYVGDVFAGENASISMNTILTLPSGTLAENTKYSALFTFDYSNDKCNFYLAKHSTSSIIVQITEQSFTNYNITNSENLQVHFGNFLTTGSALCKYYSIGMWSKKLSYVDFVTLFKNDLNIA